jgi:hypothetical protein
MKNVFFMREENPIVRGGATLWQAPPNPKGSPKKKKKNLKKKKKI